MPLQDCCRLCFNPLIIASLVLTERSVRFTTLSLLSFQSANHRVFGSHYIYRPSHQPAQTEFQSANHRVFGSHDLGLTRKQQTNNTGFNPLIIASLVLTKLGRDSWAVQQCVFQSANHRVFGSHPKMYRCANCTKVSFQSANHRVFGSHIFRNVRTQSFCVAFQSANHRVFGSHCGHSRSTEKRGLLFQSANHRVFGSHNVWSRSWTTWVPWVSIR